MYLNQKGRCAICKTVGATPEIGNPKLPLLHIDHCHTTLKVRGLLCLHCNTALGHFKECPEKLINAVDYLDSNLTEL